MVEHVVVIAGNAGSGKDTLARMLGGLLDPERRGKRERS